MGRPKKEVVPDTAAVDFWDKVTEPEGEEKKITDFDEEYNSSEVEATSLPKSKAEKEELAKAEVSKKQEAPQEDNTALDIRTAFGKPKASKAKTDNTTEEAPQGELAKAESKSYATEEVNPFADEPKVFKSRLQRKAELSALNKSEMTKEQKAEFAELKTEEIEQNTQILQESLAKFNVSIDNSPQIDIQYYREELDSIREARPKFPNEGLAPGDLITILTGVGGNIERLATLLGDLTYVFNLYEGMIDTIEDMWSVVSLQTSEQTRRGEGALQINDIKIAHNTVKGLKAAYGVELDILKQIKDTCAEQIKLIQIQIRLNEPVITEGIEGINY